KVEPLFRWLLSKDRRSVSQLEVLNKSIEIYKNPLHAVTVLGFALGLEANYSSRTYGSVMNSKLQTILRRTYDHTGHNYHFWSYLMRVLHRPLFGSRLAVASYFYEEVYQRDSDDYLVDRLAIQTARDTLQVIE